MCLIVFVVYVLSWCSRFDIRCYIVYTIIHYYYYIIHHYYYILLYIILYSSSVYTLLFFLLSSVLPSSSVYIILFSSSIPSVLLSNPHPLPSLTIYLPFSLLPFLPSSLSSLLFPIFILYLSVLTYTYLYSSVHSILVGTYIYLFIFQSISSSFPG
jgi:hypothetical protein